MVPARHNTRTARRSAQAPRRGFRVAVVGGSRFAVTDTGTHSPFSIRRSVEECEPCRRGIARALASLSSISDDRRVDTRRTTSIAVSRNALTALRCDRSSTAWGGRVAVSSACADSIESRVTRIRRRWVSWLRKKGYASRPDRARRTYERLTASGTVRRRCRAGMLSTRPVVWRASRLYAQSRGCG